MKKLFFIVLLFALLVIQNRHKIDSFLSDDQGIASAGTNEVVMFMTSWCGYCRAARQYFSDNNIPYTEYDIERSSEGKQMYDQYNVRGVPVIVINGEVIIGFDQNAISAALN